MQVYLYLGSIYGVFVYLSLGGFAALIVFRAIVDEQDANANPWVWALKTIFFWPITTIIVYRKYRGFQRLNRKDRRLNRKDRRFRRLVSIGVFGLLLSLIILDSAYQNRQLIPYCQDSGCGFVNKRGMLVVPAKFTSTRRFMNGRAPVSDGTKWGMINRQGKLVIPLEYSSFKGEWINNSVPLTYPDLFGPVNMDLIGARKIRSRVWGFIDKNNREIVPFEYTDVYPFSEGLALVRKDGPAGAFDDGKWSFIDEKGQEVIHEVIPYHGLNIEPLGFSGGLAAVSLHGKVGFINKAGEVEIQVIPLGLEKTWGFRKGSDLAPVQLLGRWGFMNKEGEVANLSYEFACPFIEGLACFVVDRKIGFVNKEGKEIIANKYDFSSFVTEERGRVWMTLSNLPRFSEGLAAVKLDGKFGYIDTTGQEVIPFIYDEARSFSEGLAAVLRVDTWGFIDKKGQEVIPSKYHTAGSFRGGIASVSTRSQGGFVMKNGREYFHED